MRIQPYTQYVQKTCEKESNMRRRGQVQVSVGEVLPIFQAICACKADIVLVREQCGG